MRILTKPSDVERYLPEIQSRADAERDALGFMPASVYQQVAEQGKLLVAVILAPEGEEYAGHVLFGGTWPQMRIFQTLVSPKFREQRVGSKLVNELIAVAEREQRTNIIIKVAKDLHDANAFYERLGFRFVTQVKGGTTRQRILNLRVRDLDTPSLFHPAPASSKSTTLAIAPISRSNSPYVLDLNVVFDLTKNRPGAEDAGTVVKAGWSHTIGLAVTPEFARELERNSHASSDPVLQLARHFPVLVEPEAKYVDALVQELAPIVFPDRHRLGKLTKQDISDLRHLAIAQHHRVAGFITSEKAILRSGSEIRRRYGLDIVALAEIATSLRPLITLGTPKIEARTRGFNLVVHDLKDRDLHKVDKIIATLGLTEEERRVALAPGYQGAPRTRLVISDHDDLVAFASWPSPTRHNPNYDLHLCANEGHPAVALAIEHLLDRAEFHANDIGPAVISVELKPGRAITRQKVMEFGYQAVADNKMGFCKARLGKIVLPSSWQEIQRLSGETFGIQLPEQPPRFTHHRQEVLLKTNVGHKAVALSDLERLMSPTIFFLPGRDAVVVPIRRSYAEDLFRAAASQISMLAAPETTLRRERAYICSPRNLRLLTEGTILLFYESGKDKGRAAIFAASRVVRSYSALKDQAEAASAAKGVLTRRDITQVSASDFVGVINFDSIMHFRQVVPLSTLRTIGCVDGTNFVKATRIEHAKAVEVLERGMQP